MAAQGPTTATPAVMTSRLTQMQMRFQQRQQQERDQRKVEMVSATKTTTVTATSGGSSSSTIRSSASTTIQTSSAAAAASIQQDLSASLGAGKVRQMFDERRHHKAAGIDKSYPLQPIGQVVGSKNGGGGSTVATSKQAATTTNANGLNNKTRVPPISANTKARLARQQQENGNGEVHGKSGGGASATFDDNENLLEDEKFPDTISFDDDFSLSTGGTPLARKLPNVGKLSSTPGTTTTNGNSGPQNVNSLKLKPVPGRVPTTTPTTLKSSGPKKAPTPAGSTAPPTNPSPRGSQPSSAKSRASTGKSGMATTATGSRKASAASLASASAASTDNGPVPDGMARCTICGRNFAEDRISKHVEICRKTKSKKRKVFDATKHRVQGTDAEKYVMRKGKAAAASSSSKKSIASTTTTAAATAASGGKGDWRRKHEEFIAAIRAAKEMKAYLAKGGKLSDLPPPPPSENPDYIQCPHCSRRFNQTAAERHIPKCATMLHNKPKPAAKAKRF